MTSPFQGGLFNAAILIKVQINHHRSLNTITGITTSDYRVKGSKFLGFLVPAASADEADAELEKIKDDHHSATHHCYAVRTGTDEIREFAQDDGEPSGTAGTPILNAMRSAGLVNALLVVVRYYGGSKLGKAGLIEAYGSAAQSCIKNAELREIVPVQYFSIRYSYDKQSLIDTLNHRFTLHQNDAEYLEQVTLQIACPLSSLESFKNYLSSIEHELAEIKELKKGHLLKKS